MLTADCVHAGVWEWAGNLPGLAAHDAGRAAAPACLAEPAGALAQETAALAGGGQ